jgi:phosphopantothenoylcysteine decarboxylase / phosphopantothenate---cysteine ligase
VADFRPARAAAGKIKKEAGGLDAVVLEQTEDILAALGARKPDGQILVGFAAETSDLRRHAAAKLARKRADVIVANDVAAPDVGFEHDTNAVVILLADGREIDVPLADKREVARSVMDVVESLWVPKGPGGGGQRSR